MRGWIYIISNPAMPGYVKVGFSTHPPVRRANELDTTGAPLPYEVRFAAETGDVHRAEEVSHELLAASRVRDTREWFRCSLKFAMEQVRQAAAEHPPSIDHTLAQLSGKVAYDLSELKETQLRELVNAQALWHNFLDAYREAQQVKGSMVWKEAGGYTYLIRKSPAGAQKSLGPRQPETEATFTNFQARKERAEARLKVMKSRIEEQRQLNKLYRVGRTPTVVVRALAALDAAGLGDKFMVIDTHAIYAYETAAGVMVDSSAMPMRDLDYLLFDTRPRIAFLTSLQKSEDRSLIKVLHKADPTFRVMRDQPQTAVNDDGFEIDIIRRRATSDDPHPMRMSDDEDDFWAAQIDQGEQIASGRRFENLVVAPNGEMATMRTLHPLDFIHLKLELAQRPNRDALKAPKDRLQAQVVKQLWEEYLQYLERAADDEDNAALRQRGESGG